MTKIIEGIRISPSLVRSREVAWSKTLDGSPKGLRKFSSILKDDTGIRLSINEERISFMSDKKILKWMGKTGSSIPQVESSLRYLHKALERYRIMVYQQFGFHAIGFVGEPTINLPRAAKGPEIEAQWVKEMALANIFNLLTKQAKRWEGMWMMSFPPVNSSAHGGIVSWSEKTALEVFTVLYDLHLGIKLPDTCGFPPAEDEPLVVLFAANQREVKV